MPSAAPGPIVAPSEAARRLTGFAAHLRLNGFVVGAEETADLARLCLGTEPLSLPSARLAFKALLSADKDQWARFDEAFDAYWLGGRPRDGFAPPSKRRDGATMKLPYLWQQHLSEGGEESAEEAGDLSDGQEERDADQRAAKSIASRTERLARLDLRKIHAPALQAEADQVAYRLAHAMRYRLSRRRKIANRGDAIDLRRTIRRNLSKGGEPVEIMMRHRPERPVKLAVFLDVSGSMQDYNRTFLSFLRGLTGSGIETEAFLFHTRLAHVTPALKTRDPMRALAQLSLLAEGMGGGTRIAESLRTFNRRYAQSLLSSRSVAIIMSDGYDTGAPEVLAEELRRLKTRVRRLVWLNPLLAGAGYEPVARGMASALPFIDVFAPAHSLQSLAALEPVLAQV